MTAVLSTTFSACAGADGKDMKEKVVVNRLDFTKLPETNPNGE
jgi:hypothetical protein